MAIPLRSFCSTHALTHTKSAAVLNPNLKTKCRSHLDAEAPPLSTTSGCMSLGAAAAAAWPWIRGCAGGLPRVPPAPAPAKFAFTPVRGLAFPFEFECTVERPCASPSCRCGRCGCRCEGACSSAAAGEPTISFDTALLGRPWRALCSSPSPSTPMGVLPSFFLSSPSAASLLGKAPDVFVTFAPAAAAVVVVWKDCGCDPSKPTASPAAADPIDWEFGCQVWGPKCEPVWTLTPGGWSWLCRPAPTSCPGRPVLSKE